MVAAALCDGRVDLATLLPETRERSDGALAARVACEGDATLGAGFDGRIEADHHRGGCIHAEVALSAAELRVDCRPNSVPTPRTCRVTFARGSSTHCSRQALSRTLVQLATVAMTSGKGA